MGYFEGFGGYWTPVTVVLPHFEIRARQWTQHGTVHAGSKIKMAKQTFGRGGGGRGGLAVFGALRAGFWLDAKSESGSVPGR